jgi:hypothetical protein
MSPAPASNQRRVLPHIKLSRRNVTRLVRPGDRPLRLDLRCLGVKAAREEESILHLRAWPVPRVEPPMAGTSVLAPTKETSRRLGEPARAGLVQQADLEGLVERARALAVKRDNLYIADDRRLLPINDKVPCSSFQFRFLAAVACGACRELANACRRGSDSSNASGAQSRAVTFVSRMFAFGPGAISGISATGREELHLPRRWPRHARCESSNFGRRKLRCRVTT